MYKIISGIYTITNLINNKIYLGKSSNLKRRLNNHKIALLSLRHENEHLQNSVNKYGIENFKFEILEEVSIEFLDSQENYWANLLNVHNRNFGYNILNCSPEGRTKVYDEELRYKLGNGQRGKKASKETKQKMSESRKGKAIHSEEFKNKLSNRAKNAKISEETRKKMSESAKLRIQKFGSNLDNYNKHKHIQIHL